MDDAVLSPTGRQDAAPAAALAPEGGAPSPAGQQPGTPVPASSRQPGAATSRPNLRATGIALLLAAAFLLGFAGFLYGLSGLQESRSQAVMFTRLRFELAGGLAPLGWTTPGRGVTADGTPIAILDIPRIGVHNMVVVQGTSSETLTLGPGHLRDSPFPGQPGVSEIFGRQATFGGPFARLGQLRRGDTIRVATGEGWSTYVVAALAPSTKTIRDPAPNRLLLLTATPAVAPAYYLTVDARLTSAVHGSPGVAPVISSTELPLAGDHSGLALTAAMEWALALALVSAGAVFAALRWSRWAAYLASAPLILAVLWNLYQSLAALLPNLY